MISIRPRRSSRLVTVLLSCALVGAVVAGPASDALTPGTPGARGADPAGTAARKGPSQGGGQAPAFKDRISGLPWSSGVTPVGVSGVNAERFGRLRQARVDNISVYPGRETWDTLTSTYWTQALPSYFDPKRDDLIVGLPLWPSTNSVDNTGTDEQWRTLGRGVARVDPNAYIRLGLEMNLYYGDWALLKGNADRWIPAWRRAATLIQQGCPRCKMVWNPNHGYDSVSPAGETRVGYPSRQAFLKLKDLIDVYAIDDYDIYPAMLDNASRRYHMDSYGQFNESYRFARKHGKLFAVPEWGIACNDKASGCFWAPDAGGDNPIYPQTLIRWFAARSRYLAFETYFDEPGRGSRSSLYTRPIGPRAGKAYREEIRKVKRSFR